MGRAGGTEHDLHRARAGGGAGVVFDECRRRLTGLDYSVWAFRPPLDSLFRLSPAYPTRQAIYAFTRDPGLLDALRAYAQPWTTPAGKKLR